MRELPEKRIAKSAQAWRIQHTTRGGVADDRWHRAGKRPHQGGKRSPLLERRVEEKIAEEGEKSRAPESQFTPHVSSRNQDGKQDPKTERRPGDKRPEGIGRSAVRRILKSASPLVPLIESGRSEAISAVPTSVCRIDQNSNFRGAQRNTPPPCS